ncbi:MAG: (2Fe-2S)-binding protein [Roseivirga sp.]|nr:(2Fe-2S)-binding protein [Roseivirga sp.]
MELKINGNTYDVDVEPGMPLLWVLRDELNLTGTKYGCGVAYCGACTVHLDGQPVRSCALPAAALAGREITTIEGIEQNQLLSKIQEAWLSQQVPQCGYCQSGMIMAVEGLFKQNPSPTEEELETAITNICRCGTYQRIKEAVMQLSNENKEA